MLLEKVCPDACAALKVKTQDSVNHQCTRPPSDEEEWEENSVKQTLNMDLDSAEIVQHVCIIYLFSIFVENIFFMEMPGKYWNVDTSGLWKIFCFLVLGFKNTKFI